FPHTHMRVLTSSPRRLSWRPMKRRYFGKAIATGAAGAALGAPLSASQSKPSRKAAMHVGCQSGGVTTENLEFKARHGVFNIDGDAPKKMRAKAGVLEH